MGLTRLRLSGLYTDPSLRHYVILQDDLCRVGKASLVHVRVMRERHPYVQSGTVRTSDEMFDRIAAADAEPNGAISAALICWLENRSMKLRFAVRVVGVTVEGGAVAIQFDEAAVQSS